MDRVRQGCRMGDLVVEWSDTVGRYVCGDGRESWRG